MNDFWQFLVLAIGAGGGTSLLVKLAEGFFKRGDLKLDDNAKLRKELAEQIESLTERIEKQSSRQDKTDAELVDWKNKYFELLGKYNDVQSNFTILKAESVEKDKHIVNMQAEIDDLKQQVSVLRGQKVAKKV
jgi:chromosome segregation ATPase